jgi:ATP-dependent Zn protease
MQLMLDEAYASVKAMLNRNRAALDMLIDRLISAPDQQLDGTEVRQILEQNGDSSDLQHRREKQAVFA